MAARARTTSWKKQGLKYSKVWNILTRGYFYIRWEAVAAYHLHVGAGRWALTSARAEPTLYPSWNQHLVTTETAMVVDSSAAQPPCCHGEMPKKHGCIWTKQKPELVKLFPELTIKMRILLWTTSTSSLTMVYWKCRWNLHQWLIELRLKAKQPNLVMCEGDIETTERASQCWSHSTLPFGEPHFCLASRLVSQNASS